MVASPGYNCLYVSDLELRAVHLYNLSNDVITRWSVGGECYGLSLTSTHNVLVTLYDTRQVQEYSPDGRRLIREINLDGSTAITILSIFKIACITRCAFA